MRSRIVAASVLVLWAGALPPAAAQTVDVTAAVETKPVPHSGDAADDPCIWIHPTDPSLSLVIGTDKQGGLAVYDLTGHELQYLPDGDLNNADIRYGFPLGGERVDLVTAGNRSSDTIAIYRVDALTRTLMNVSVQPPIHAGLVVYGSTMYHSPATGKYYFFVNSKDGDFEQWELFDDKSGKVDGAKVRSFSVGSITEGCVADDQFSDLYIAEETVAIWKYGAEPGDGTARTQIDTAGGGGHLTADIEGLTLYYASDGTGYLLASSQGSSEFAIYRREGGHAYVGKFRLVDGPSIDGVSDTDGIDVTNVNLGPAFPGGVFVTQDGDNSPDNQNYKLVPWELIAGAMTPPLAVDTSWDPRGRDEDGDGYHAPTDCDDHDPGVHPGAVDACDGIDNDCDGTPDGADADSDGIPAACDDCPGVPNPGQADTDGDGSGDACELTVTAPLRDQTLDCSEGALPPTIVWSPYVYDRFKVIVSWTPDFRGKTKATSGRKRLTATSWTVPVPRWHKLCRRAGSNLYIKVLGVDLDSSKKAPNHLGSSTVVTDSLQH